MRVISENPLFFGWPFFFRKLIPELFRHGYYFDGTPILNFDLDSAGRLRGIGVFGSARCDLHKLLSVNLEIVSQFRNTSILKLTIPDGYSEEDIVFYLDFHLEIFFQMA